VVLSDGRAALERQAWSDAADHLAGGPESDPRGEAERLDLLGDALWWLGRLDACIEAREAAYALLEAQHEERWAGQVAIWLYEHHIFAGRPAMAGGWLRRARRALHGDEDCVEWGNLLLREAEEAHGAGELSHALDGATAALELGRRLRSDDLEAEALQTMGRVLIDATRPREGMAHLDEAMLLAVEGRLGAYATGKVYCSLVTACEDVGDLRRAAEWTQAAARWSEQHPFAVFPGLCRVKRAGVLQRRGEWQEAEREARLACEELADVRVGSAGTAWAEVGEIRRRLGDLGGAESAFEEAEAHGFTPTAGLALLRLAQGRVEAASGMVAVALDDPAAPPLARARILPAAVQVALATGDADLAGERVAELERIASTYESPALLASACTALGRVRLGAGDHPGACGALRRAVDRWQALDVPYETATAQLLLGEAARACGDDDLAGVALDAATAAFERLGVVHDARRTGAAPAGALPAGLSAREAEVLRLVAEGRTNKDIAAALGLSQKTIARHVSNIFTKTGAPTRTAAAAFAYDHGIVGRR
jgi:DNA-binding CsgD family transcriptional regulator